MVTTPTVDEVEAGYQGNPVAVGDLDSSDADQLIQEAVDMYDDVFSDQILFQAEGRDSANAVRYLARHKWAVALGDTVQSEGQAGGNASYNVPTSTERSLGRTEYGQEFLEYFRDVPNVSVKRTR